MSCRVKDLDPRRYAPAVGSDLWRTVEHLEGPPLFFQRPEMVALTSLKTTARLHATDLLTRRPPYGLTSLECFLDQRDLALLDDPAPLPELRRLFVMLLKPEVLPGLTRTPLFGQLERFGCSVGRYRQEIAQWRGRLEPTGVPELVVEARDYQGSTKEVRYHFRRGPEGRLSELELSFSALTRRDGWAVEMLGDMASTLRALAPDGLTALSVRPARRLPEEHFGPDPLAPLRAAAEAAGGLERCEIP